MVKFDTISKKIVAAPIKAYRKISPYKGFSCCKYYPTCSQYALEAIEKKGAFKGLLLAIWRVLRCNPFSKGGYDPVK
ncbi:MAG: membrane protein insertion efficiency factor YidD [Lachnospiraceae bacterium]|nr:membrane protein insertion efficiency factor YidD [Lachnospiraceae bacterium]